jgi:hypothetical protein
MQPKSRAGAVTPTEETPLLPKESTPVTTMKARTIPRREKEKHKQAELSKDEVACNEAKRRVNEMIGNLESEIIALSGGCFFFFNRYEITTKRVKKSALEQLQNAKSLAVMQDTIRTIMRNNQRALRSWRTARTERLFDMILNHEDELYQVGMQQLTK